MSLIRIRKIEEGDGYKILEFPFWASTDLMRRAADNVQRDAAIKGKRLTITIGRHLMRVEEEGQP